jgi:hypothetical protein
VILDLQRRVEALPARRKAAERLATIRKFREVSLAAAAQQQRALEGIACTQETFDAANLREAHATVGRNTKTASRLLKALAEIEAIDKHAIDSIFQDLQTGTAKALSIVEQEWTRQINAVANRYQRIISVAERAGLSGSRRLNETLGKIQQVTKPRCGRGLSVSAFLSELHETVRTVGLESEGGRFLTRVADGSASARDLTRPEIVKFLTDHDLWSLLSVRFTQ